MFNSIDQMDLPQTVALNVFNFEHGQFTISTIDLKRFSNFGFHDKFETCVFDWQGHSEIIATYKTLGEALVGHMNACKLAKTMNTKSIEEFKNAKRLHLDSLQEGS